MQPKIGVIGGSGVYQLDALQNPEWITVETPWGAPSDAILTGTLNGTEMAFLPRHGRGHVHSPSSVPYRANIDALKRLGVTDILAVSAVGSPAGRLQTRRFRADHPIHRPHLRPREELLRRRAASPTSPSPTPPAPGWVRPSPQPPRA